MIVAGNDDDPVFGHVSSSRYLNIPPDALLADDPHEAYNRAHEHRHFIAITVGATIGLALATGCIGWYIYSRLASSEPADTAIPILQAVPEAIKIRPNNPGGLDVPNRDKLIYQQMGEVNAASGGEEHLLPPIETLAEPPESESVGGGRRGGVPSSIQTATPRRPNGDLTIPMATISPSEGPFPETVTSPVASVPSAPVVIVSPPVMLAPPGMATIQPERPMSSLSELIARRVELSQVDRNKNRMLEEKSSTARPVTRPIASAAVPSLASLRPPISKAVVGVSNGSEEGEAHLQLGSFTNTKDAEKAWLQLVNHHGDLLRGIVHTLAQVDLGAKGSWYRIYAGPYNDRRVALSICHALQQRGVGCIFAHK